MRNSKHNPNAFLKHNRQGKDKRFQTQFETVYKALHDKPKTMLMVAEETGIYRANICRFVATLRKLHKVAVVTLKRCQITKHTAGYLTTDPLLFPKTNQLNLFEPLE